MWWFLVTNLELALTKQDSEPVYIQICRLTVDQHCTPETQERVIRQLFIHLFLIVLIRMSKNEEFFITFASGVDRQHSLCTRMLWTQSGAEKNLLKTSLTIESSLTAAMKIGWNTIRAVSNFTISTKRMWRTLKREMEIVWFPGHRSHWTPKKQTGYVYISGENQLYIMRSWKWNLNLLSHVSLKKKRELFYTMTEKAQRPWTIQCDDSVRFWVQINRHTCVGQYDVGGHGVSVVCQHRHAECHVEQGDTDGWRRLVFAGILDPPHAVGQRQHDHNFVTE